MTDAATAILCVCDPSYQPGLTVDCYGMTRPDADAVRICNDATDAERKAARALTATRKRRRKLLDAIHALDSYAGAAITAYSMEASHPSTPADYVATYDAVSHSGPMSRQEFRDAHRDAAEARHDRREAEALDHMIKTCTATRAGNLRRRLVAALRECGVTHGTYMHPGSDADNPTLHAYRSLVTTVRAWDTLRHCPQYPEHARCRATLVERGWLASE